MSKILRKTEVLNYLDKVLLGDEVERRRKPSPSAAEEGSVKTPKRDSGKSTVRSQSGWVELIRNRVDEDKKLVIDAEPVICERKSGDFKKISLEKVQYKSLSSPNQGSHDTRCSTIGFGRADLVYSAGQDHRVILYKIKGSNSFEQFSSTLIEGCPMIRSSCLSSDESRIYFGGGWGRMMSLDLETR